MIIDKNEYLSHISNDQERRQMRRVLDFIEITIDKHKLTNTDFLEPNLVKHARSILNRFDQIKYSIEGGFENAERNIIIIYPWYHYYDKYTDNPLKAIEITGNIENLNHSHVLGSILGLGIVRDKVGDIAFFDEKIQVVLSNDVFDYILLSLKKIDKEYIDLKAIDANDLGKIVEEGTSRQIIVSSNRMDTVISEFFNISRAKVSSMIEKDLVKLNHSVERKAHVLLEENDLVSVRRYGRFRILSFDGKTRKGRLRLTVFQPE